MPTRLRLRDERGIPEKQEFPWKEVMEAGRPKGSTLITRLREGGPEQKNSVRRNGSGAEVWRRRGSTPTTEDPRS